MAWGLPYSMRLSGRGPSPGTPRLVRVGAAGIDSSISLHHRACILFLGLADIIINAGAYAFPLDRSPPLPARRLFSYSDDLPRKLLCNWRHPSNTAIVSRNRFLGLSVGDLSGLDP